MTKSEMFKAAHKLAKTFVGNYRACFVMALTIVREDLKAPKTFVNISDVKVWEKGTTKRVYFTSNISGASGQYFYDIKEDNLYASGKKSPLKNFIGSDLNLIIKLAA